MKTKPQIIKEDLNRWTTCTSLFFNTLHCFVFFGDKLHSSQTQNNSCNSHEDKLIFNTRKRRNIQTHNITWTHAELLTCPGWTHLPHGGRSLIPFTKEQSQVHILLLTLPSVFGLSACSNPDPINGYTPGSISQALGCQMWYGITLAWWCKAAQINRFFKAFGSCHQPNHSNQDSDWCWTHERH